MSEVKPEELFPDMSENDEPLPGDADESGSVDTKDITVVLDYMMNKKPEKFNFENADANNDKVINIADILTIVNIIMGN
jgi:hypothetical protein